MRTMILPALAAVALAGCGGIAPEAERNVTNVNSDEAANAEANVAGNVAEADNATAKVLALNDAQRNGVFYRAIEDANLTCQRVTSSDRLPDQDGKPVWRANCGGKIEAAKAAYIISIAPDGTAQIIGRNDR
ncbi:hypothetical protein [Sphingomonas soli]|uniref:hypothetical protein n=1 Tax=Sphingomonas soli TaxID=266127 RepID=UPI000834DAE9|nr:hypothetical protein [Sphingomonas soli]